MNMETAVTHLPTAKTQTFKIEVSHPHGNANSHNAALAFYENQWLQFFQTGILTQSMASRLTSLFSVDASRRAQNRVYEDIPASRKRSHFFFEAASRIGRKLRPTGLTSRINWYDVLFGGHDLLVSRTLNADLDAVYAYEDGALQTFKAAKHHGVTAIYELPLGYYEGVAYEINLGRKDWPDFQRRAYVEPDWKQSRKRAELQLSDVVIVPCDWALNSLRFSDASADRVVKKVPYGTPVEEINARKHVPSGPFTVLFAGHVGLRKGVPHLINAWERLGLKDARLLIAGSMDLPRDYIDEHGATFEYLGAQPRAELLETMKTSDLFVFPSLAEGFGLVIGEAMACGVPVLTTSNTGGPELIKDGVEGWCVAGHKVEPLIERIEWAYSNRDELRRMGQRARQSAEQWTWSDYRRKLIEELSPSLLSRISREAEHEI